jgi:hypothetical protein
LIKNYNVKSLIVFLENPDAVILLKWLALNFIQGPVVSVHSNLCAEFAAPAGIAGAG